ncbi:sugar O-acetyltransferase [Coprobacter sp.]|uniref:sugar O-acetyltransferase n=1 Tax=Coprobacter sp. TaxID=1941478 RepID=UPI002600FBD5|nr:sugar O-acetyltransferase [uncultured Coprobacter sp.]
MTIETFKEYVKARKAFNTEEIHHFMDDMSNEARRVSFRLNTTYHTPDKVRELLSELFGYSVPQSLRVFPPFYTDFGKNISVGENVFINACCHFQDHGGITIGDGCQIGHNVVFATLNHGLAPEDRKTTYPAPITLGKNVWVGSNATILQDVSIGDNAIIGAGAVVTKNVEANTIVGGVPARFIKSIENK